MSKLRWTVAAQRDVMAIGHFMRKDNPAAATALVRLFHAKARSASRMPRTGRRVPEVGRDEVREIVVKNYRIVYEVGEGGGITVLHVFEAHRSFPAI
jgi:toxin ParE1/3/4